MNEERELVVNVKKIDLKAKNPYQYHKMETAPFFFVPCVLEESHDELKLTFNLEGLRKFCDQKKLRAAQKYSVLIQLLESRKQCPEYMFSMDPENLYLDAQDRIRILNRDIGEGTQEEKDHWLLDFKAFAGSLFQRKYSYDNLKHGGLELLKKRKSTRFLVDINSAEEAVPVLVQAQEQEREYDQQEYTYVKSRRYHRTVVLMILGVTSFLLAAGWGLYQNFWITVPQQKALIAERAYMEDDLTGVIDALASLPLEQIDRHEKYILAVSYIRGQSVDTFNNITKNLLISKLSYNGDQNLLDYWIHLGRLEIDKALDVAQRISDNQLILYAYLQKLDQISSDLTLSGEVKAQQMESLKGKIKTLAEELGISYKESE